MGEEVTFNDMQRIIEAVDNNIKFFNQGKTEGFILGIVVGAFLVALGIAIYLIRKDKLKCNK